MVKLNLLGFLLVAVIFHTIYIYSIFDIYFVSPIVHGMQQHKTDAEPPAKRLFLIVGDGLRADKCFQAHPPPYPKAGEDLTPRPLAPFLRSKVLNHGTFGVSHTRVPTESRPGHVALIAGLYEDVSAVTTGWKENPVNFDSVFNQSRHTWSWGSPDILPMFKDGATPGRVDAYTYAADEEDFTAGDASLLDKWVFDRVEGLFERAKTDNQLAEQLRQNKIVFFLHLLGLDMNGHSYRPYSREYLNNINFVDEGVKRMEKIVNEFYGNDDSTAWVFTADHGMSDWGSHGDGHPNNTRTPLITWGAGINKPVVVSKTRVAEGHQDGYSSDWNLDHVTRHDVNQADIAALMASLIGVNFPANSVGELPMSYLSSDRKTKAKAFYANAQQILEMYIVKEKQKSAVTINYKPYEPLSEEGASITERFTRASQLIESGLYDNAIGDCMELMQLGLEGLRYLQTYDWLFLRAIVTFGYLGWIAFALTNVVSLHVLQAPSAGQRTALGVSCFVVGLLSIYTMFFLQESPWTYYAYALFPFIFWEEVWSSRSTTMKGLGQLFKGRSNFKRIVSILVKTACAIVFLEALVFGYFQRLVFSAFFLLGTLWPVSQGGKFVKKNLVATASWVLCCLSMSAFTLLPVIKQESLLLINIAGVVMTLIGLLYMMFGEKLTKQAIPKEHAGLSLGVARFDQVSKSIMGLQVGLVVLAVVVTNSSVRYIQSKSGLPLGNQMVGWLTLVASLLVPMLNRIRPQKHFSHRLMVVFLTFSPTFIILTISYEAIFYVVFSITLIVWVHLERQIYVHKLAKAARNPGPKQYVDTTNDKQPRPMVLTDTRVALFFFFFIQVAFFGTGNVASISAFSLDSVYRLIPIFNPFAMSALLLFKLLIPFAVISVNLGILNRQLEVAPSALFMLVMALSDILTMNFFFMVKDEGSWLEIGTTISHFCIASLLCVFVAALEFLSEAFVSGVEMVDEKTSDGSVAKQALHPSTNGTYSKSVGVNGESISSKSLAPVANSSATDKQKSFGRSSRRRR